MPGRKCGKCKRLKAWNHFRKDKKGLNGHQSVCKKCEAKYELTYRNKLRKRDPLKLKAWAFRGNCKDRAPDLELPTSNEIYEWLHNYKPFVCYYTGTELKPTDFSIDHKQPLKRGGTHALSNLCVVTKAMNNAKGNMTEKEFKDLLALVNTWEDKGVSILGRLKVSGKAFKRGFG